MTAAAFTQTLILRGLSNNRIIHVPMTLSDVATAYAIMPDGNSFLQIPSDQAYSLQDLIVITGGTDTNIQALWINGLNSGIVINNKSNLNTGINRQFQSGPVAFKAGSMLRFIQAV